MEGSAARLGAGLKTPADIVLTANYLFFFSRFAFFFSFAVFWGAVFLFFLESCDFDIPFTSYITTMICTKGIR